MSAEYYVSAESYDHKYGIVAINRANKHSAVTMPFLNSIEEAELVVSWLRECYYSVSEFRDLYLSGELEEKMPSLDWNR